MQKVHGHVHSPLSDFAFVGSGQILEGENRTFHYENPLICHKTLDETAIFANDRSVHTTEPSVRRRIQLLDNNR
jgi:hypothetical protein